MSLSLIYAIEYRKYLYTNMYIYVPALMSARSKTQHTATTVYLIVNMILGKNFFTMGTDLEQMNALC